ncbi:hypothetical protein EW145_g3349 [Phellinidium pouzarii]|uniref:Ty3 transposon capsid-like protein domain-containing protein n=1 Tax=Phellinidium pouzarii TaxID=167371 RepID=A0A4S4L7E2_9AGAM|nr:hypothetical protein EW145_g3349 [Phellinidium pouzarii]
MRLTLRRHKAANSQSFAVDADKILFVLSYLKGGHVATWAENYVDSRTVVGMMMLTATFNDFMMEFAQAFDDPNRAEKAMGEFQTFMQGKLTADQFFASFEILRTKAKLNQVAHDAIVIDRLKRALDAKVVMGVMHSSPVPTTYNDWKAKVIQVDQVEQQIGQVMKACNPQQVPLNRPWQPQQVPQHPQVPQPQPAATQQTHDWQGVTPGTHPGMGIPMDVSINNACCN